MKIDEISNETKLLAAATIVSGMGVDLDGKNCTNRVARLLISTLTAVENAVIEHSCRVAKREQPSPSIALPKTPQATSESQASFKKL